MDDVDSTRSDLFAKYREECLKRNLSNSENFDRSILTLSSAALALSVTFLAKLPGNANCPNAMLLSWVCFVAAVVSTLASFLVSQAALDKSVDQAERYYIDGQAEAIDERNVWKVWNTRLTYISAASFLIGIVTLLFFVSQNLG